MTGDVEGENAVSTEFATSTTVFPWGLLVIGLVVLQIMLLGIRNVLRRREHRTSPALSR